MSPTESEAMRALRRELHRHPELAWQEHSSRDRIAARLQALGLSPRPMASTGLPHFRCRTIASLTNNGI